MDLIKKFKVSVILAALDVRRRPLYAGLFVGVGR